MWALQYWIYLDRRTQIDDAHEELELQTFFLWPERWEQLQQHKNQTGAAGDMGQAFGGEREIPVTDPDELDRFYGTGDGDPGQFYASLDQPRSMSGAEALSVLGFAEGPGRRV